MAAETGDGASQWTETEVAELISIWGDNSIQAKLEGLYRNRAVFECIAKEMIERGHRRTWLQCQRKIKSLRAKFKEAKDINKRTGRGRVTCPFYDELDRILGDKPSCQPIELIDSSIETAEEEPESPRASASPGASASPAPSLNSEKGYCHDLGGYLQASNGGSSSFRRRSVAPPWLTTCGQLFRQHIRPALSTVHRLSICYPIGSFWSGGLASLIPAFLDLGHQLLKRRCQLVHYSLACLPTSRPHPGLPPYLTPPPVTNAPATSKSSFHLPTASVIQLHPRVV
ncbi:unnamed protein product [Oreochromis niloticus]|nr:unnamed protein product [Mustela putorius furo]